MESVVAIKDFCPISLCDVSSKVITKTLGQCLKVIMEHIVSPV